MQYGGSIYIVLKPTPNWEALPSAIRKELSVGYYHVPGAVRFEGKSD